MIEYEYITEAELLNVDNMFRFGRFIPDEPAGEGWELVSTAANDDWFFGTWRRVVVVEEEPKEDEHQRQSAFVPGGYSGGGANG